MLDRTAKVAKAGSVDWRTQPAWVVVLTEHRRERLAKGALQEKEFETYLPEYSCRVKRSKNRSRKQRGQTETVTRVLFPGYLFMRAVLRGHDWKRAFSCQGVKGMLIEGELPGRVPDQIIERIRSTENCGISEATPELAFAPGQTVRVEEGPFAGFEALVEAIKAGDVPEEAAVHCLLALFGRQVRIVLQAAQLGRP